MSEKPLADEWEQAEEALERLDIKDAPQENGASSPQVVVASAESPPSDDGPPLPSSSLANTQNGDLDHLVDHALRDALSKPKHRMSVLQLEKEVEAFIVDSTEPNHLFAGEMSSYDRLLTHRTAQHWGLETCTVSSGPDQGRILATRNPRTGIPPIKLADLPVTVEEAITSSGLAPQRVLVRKRNERARVLGSPGQSGGIQGAFDGRMQPIEDRELHYEKTRARIFGDASGGPPPPYGGDLNGQTGYPIPMHMNMHMSASFPGQKQSPMPPSMMPYPYPAGGVNPAMQGMVGIPPPPRGPPPPYGGPPVSYGGAQGQAGRVKAQLRNRQEDLSDPDFRRGRHGPRFDPGFNEDLQGGIYSRPTYSSEFPELGPGMHGSQRPNGGMAYPSPTPMLAPGYGPYGYVPTMMYPSAAGGAGVGVPYSAGPGSYAVAMGPYGPTYGYVAMRPDQAVGGMMPTGMVPMQMYPGAFPGGPHSMGGVPMSPKAGGGFGGGLATSPQSGLGRQRSTGQRSRNGGGSRASSSTVNTPRSDLLLASVAPAAGEMRGGGAGREEER